MGEVSLAVAIREILLISDVHIMLIPESIQRSMQLILPSSSAHCMNRASHRTCAGQVIVLGATNRPDAVDPAMRRPGRFDREFYFPLPNKEARKKIIQINTKSWEPKLEDGVLDMLGGLTKGYGGADLRVRHAVWSL
jgi:SpoVK/Ycf46/Vps4 family AAA+-type ATPase